MAPKKKNQKPQANVTVAHNPHEEAPKKKQKLKKEKVTVVHEADLIPLRRLNKLKVDTGTVKILKDSHLWNEVLLSKDRNSVLGRIKDLTDPMRDQICEAVNKIMEYDVDVFTKKTVEALQKTCQKKEIGTWLRRVLCEAERCVQNCYTADELRERLHEEFDEEFGYRLGLGGMDAVITEVYDDYFAGRKEHMAYSYMSSIRAEQRKEQKDKQEAEPKELLEKQQADVQKSEKVQAQEAVQKKKQEALSQQVTTLMDEFRSLQMMFDDVKSSESKIATKDDLSSFGRDLTRGLNSLGRDLTAGVGDRFTSSSKSLEEKVTSELERVLIELDTKFKEHIQIASAAAAAEAAPSIQQRISLAFLQRELDACFSMAVEADDATFGWLLSLINPELVSNLWAPALHELPMTNETFLSLLLRLADLVLAQEGEHMIEFRRWFKAIRNWFSPPFPQLEIPDAMMSRVLEADALCWI